LDSDAGATRDAPIVISDAETWEANIPEVATFLSLAGVWMWDMEFYEAGKSSPLTLYRGKLNVVNDVTA